MEPKLLNTKITTQHAEYTRAGWAGRNQSGMLPLTDKVLVLVDRVEARTTGGIELPDDVQERANLSAESGVIVAVGPIAFKYSDTGRLWEGDKPGPGTHVFFQKYSGTVLRGRDGRMYRTMDAQCIGAVALPDEAADPFMDVNITDINAQFVARDGETK